MRFSYLFTAAGLLLTGLALAPETTWAQTTTRPRPATKPTVKPPATATAVVTNPAASSPAAGSASKKGDSRVMEMPENDMTMNARKLVETARAKDLADLSPDQIKAQLQQPTEGSALYDEHFSSPGHSVMANLMRWRDHLVLQIALRDAELDPKLDAGEFTLLAPTDAALLPLSKEAHLPRGLVQGYILPGTQRLATIPEGEQTMLKTLDGQLLIAERKGGEVWLTTSTKRRINVTLADVQCANGLISVIDQPLMPKGQ